MSFDYSTEYDGYWASEERFGEQSFADAGVVAEEILLSCGGQRILDIGSGMGQLVCSFLSQGIDAHGLDVSQVAVSYGNTLAPNRFHLGSVLALPFDTASFDTVVSTDCLEHLSEEDVRQALNEIRRVTRKAVYLRIATTLDRDGHWHLTVKPREWWEQRFFEAGFRKHTAYYQINDYENLQKDGWQITILLECIPDAALALYPLEALLEERDLHMDMLRETGARSDAHIVRYQWASSFVRPGDTVLDAACGLGYGSYVIQSSTMAERTLGIDGSAYAIDYANANFSSMVPNLSFQLGMLPDALFDIPDHSVDVVLSFETLEHVEANKALIAEFHRILTPAGRIITSVPNDWSDETGMDPNPYHLHVYTLERLRNELEAHFIVEKIVAQSASQHKTGFDRKSWVNAERSLREVPINIAEDQAPDAEWWLAVAMRDPAEGIGIPYRETQFPTYDAPNWNVTTFGRDYRNPWLVRGMVDMGHRLQDKFALKKVAEEVCRTSEQDSPDVGAGLCALGYQLLSGNRKATADEILSFSHKVSAYIELKPKTPHGVRWTISLYFVLGKLWMAVGDFARAASSFKCCVAIDPIGFSPLLCNRTVEAWLVLGVLSLVSGEKETAKSYWQQGIEQAKRAVTTDWSSAIGDSMRPAEFGLPELASILDYASSCSYALANLDHFETKPWWWLHFRRNRLSQASVISIKDANLKIQGIEIHRLNALVEAKDQATSYQASEIHRLLDVIGQKEAGLTAQAEEIHRLLDVIGQKEVGLTAQAEEIHRLLDVIGQKEVGLTAQAEKIQRLLDVIGQKEKGLTAQTEEIHRLLDVIGHKEMGLTAQGEEIQRLFDVIGQKEVGLTAQAEEIHRLLDVIEQKEIGLIAQAKEIHRLFDVIEQKETALTAQVDEIHRLETDVVAKQYVINELSQRFHAQESELRELFNLQKLVNDFEAERHYFYSEVAKRDSLLSDATISLELLQSEFRCVSGELRTLQQTRWFRLREVMLFQPFGVRKLSNLIRLIIGGVLPRRMRTYLRSKLTRGGSLISSSDSVEDSGAYHVKLPPSPPIDAPRVVHVIANFMTGGSSRLVVDLVEHLGSRYHQLVLTSFNPSPPAYVGLDIEECRFPDSFEPFVEYYKRVQPDFVHVHYWGDCDEPWYSKAIEAAGLLGLPVIENINTPIDPYRSDAVARYVYVSDYVRSVFGDVDSRHVTVYPGSDFRLFMRAPNENVPENCVGMVYRLERDKLNDESILPFIRIAQLRPSTKILIVGGGSLLEPFRAAVDAAGVSDNFEFTGYVGYDVLPDLYRRMSLFVAPVWKESFGQVSPFAMSMKVPVIGYDIGAIPEIIANQALVAPSGDVDCLAKIAVQLLDSPVERLAIGEAQRQRAQENFSVQAMIDHYAEIYAEIAQTICQESK